MSRDIFVNGPVLVNVKGRSDSAIASLSQLGLSESAVVVTPIYHHDDIIVDATGPAVPIDEQMFLAEAQISMALVHFDRSVLDTCLALAMATVGTPGTMPAAGTRMGGGVVRFAPGNNYIGLNLTSPVGGKPWRFYYAKLERSVTIPIGTKRSIVQLNWRAIPYSVDPWNAGAGSAGNILWDYQNDS